MGLISRVSSRTYRYMGNANTAPPNVDNDSNSPDGQKKLTDEENRFTQVYSLGGTRFEIDTQRFLAGDSTDLSLICRQSLDFYKTTENTNHRGTSNKKRHPKSNH